MQRREARGDRGQGGKVDSGMAAGPRSNKCRAAGRCHRIRACQRSPRRRQRAQNSRRPRGGVSPGGAGWGGAPRQRGPCPGPGSGPRSAPPPQPSSAPGAAQSDCHCHRFRGTFWERYGEGEGVQAKRKRGEKRWL